MKPQPKAKVFYLRLDSDDVEGDQIKYLTGILKKHASQGDGFSVRFLYDVDGTSHWDGKHFVIDAINGFCYLRLAGRGDVDSRNPKTAKRRFTYDDKQNWQKICAKIDAAGMHEPKKPEDIVIAFEFSFPMLKAEDLQSALKIFQVSDVMFI